MTTLSKLNNWSLLTILDQIPLRHLFTLATVCKRWDALIPDVCHRRRILAVSENLSDLGAIAMKGSALAYSTYHVARSDDWESARVHAPPYLQVNALVLPNVDLVSSKIGHLIGQLFPNLTHLYLVCKYGSTEHLQRTVVPLLGFWSSKLRHLHLSYNSADPDEVEFQEESTIEAFTALLELINSSTSLRHLSLDLQADGRFTGDSLVPLHLPISGQLTSLYFSCLNLFDRPTDNNLELINQFREYGHPRKVYLGSDISLGNLVLVPNEIASSIKLLNIPDTLTRLAVARLDHLCSTFTSLTSLCIHFSPGSWDNFVASLSKLYRLEELTLFYEPTLGRLLVPESNPRNVLPSVRVLIILSRTRSHEDVRFLSLQTVFPNVQVAALLSFNLNCAVCKYFRLFGDDGHVNSVEVCNRLARRTYLNGFPKLKVIIRQLYIGQGDEGEQDLVKPEIDFN